MQQGFLKVAAATPGIHVGDCDYNARQIITLMQSAAEAGVKLIVFPELSLCGATCGDLFLQDTLIKSAQEALLRILSETAELDMLTFLGMPIVQNGKHYNCAVAVKGGALLGVVPKINISGYGERFEYRFFTPGETIVGTVTLAGLQAPFGAHMVFPCASMPELVVGAEIGEDLWLPSPPSAALAAQGATVIVNLSASSEVVGNADARRLLIKSQSARLSCAYLYADAGWGESTTDMVFAGHNLIAENGKIINESLPFAQENAWTETEIDLFRLHFARRRRHTHPPAGNRADCHLVSFDLCVQETTISRTISRHPFVPESVLALAARCEEVLRIQAEGLRKRLTHINGKSLVVGVSGGLDSTLALLVCVQTLRWMHLPVDNITAVTMPCFGTTTRTKNNAHILCEALGIPCKTVDITKAVQQHFRDIDQPEDRYDAAYENAQARERTQVLMDIANQTGGLVVGTGDMSELALGWATYNGDHMSMYAVNASVPKTLIRHIVRHVAETCGQAQLQAVLCDILDTPVSPELLPAKDGKISQQTETIVGPYELHDFFLYYFVRWGMEPKKILRLATLAFRGEYDEKTIRAWLIVFTKRFFTQQFKRSCMPDGPKVGSVSLSPRGSLHMPSDAVYTAWLAQIEE
ncbi:NAD(+) synthase [Christensenellaceae bacterium OttesenSCG-928-L17]|nr:NAD(+) synthase [Christensenellaceae bacterium OttesenSCG-928-L17]